ncbi:hypothetical protein VNO77_23513 [Canavalia gladiata]|uniref:Uncharacterized protein n=1 Tax=Canavalia gladiata TaxID=3824 RepID=A0AAN9L4L0_CANGL
MDEMLPGEKQPPNFKTASKANVAWCQKTTKFEQIHKSNKLNLQSLQFSNKFRTILSYQIQKPIKRPIQRNLNPRYQNLTST